MIDWVRAAVEEAGAKAVKVIANPNHADGAPHLGGRVEVVYQRDPKGCAQALGHIPAGELRGRQDLVANGDSPLLTATSIRRVIDAHVQEKAPATIASVVDPTRDDGRVIRAADGSLERIVERKDATPEMRVGVHEFNVGLYCFDGSKLVEELGTVGDDNNAGEYYLTDVFLHLKPVPPPPPPHPREAMGVKDRVRLATATEILRRRLLDNLMLGGVTIVDPNSTFIDAGAVIGQDTASEPFTVLDGSTQIAAECPIGPHRHPEAARPGDRSHGGPS